MTHDVFFFFSRKKKGEAKGKLCLGLDLRYQGGRASQGGCGSGSDLENVLDL